MVSSFRHEVSEREIPSINKNIILFIFLFFI